ncbi:MAG: hypothetical protein IIW92_04720 [Lachnospiraceae bacterium]|nr:hypothetical protein [Lachnospiraceae bacterium]MEE0863192.1 hypothetical protein [Lachnospiraceae bacterium]
MDNSLKGLILAAGTIITCVVISLGFFIAREAKDTASNGANQINKLNSEFVESDKVIYDGATVSGSEVINVIKKFKNEKLGILVKTNKSKTYYGYSFDENDGDIIGQVNSKNVDPTDSDSVNYVNPYVNFVGRIIRDKNEVITGIVFEQ